MSSSVKRPLGVWIVAAVLLWSALSGAFVALQEMFGDSPFPPLPVLGDGVVVIIAHWCVGFMWGAFFLSGIALLLSRWGGDTPLCRGIGFLLALHDIGIPARFCSRVVARQTWWRSFSIRAFCGEWYLRFVSWLACCQLSRAAVKERSIALSASSMAILVALNERAHSN